MWRCGIPLHRIGGCGTRCSGSGASLSPASCPCLPQMRVSPRRRGVDGAGVALILAFARCKNSRSARRRRLEKNVEGMLVEDEVKKCEKNVDGMLTEDKVKKVDTPMMHVNMMDE